MCVCLFNLFNVDHNVPNSSCIRKKRFLIKQINKLMEIMDVYECFKINSRYLKWKLKFEKIVLEL